MSSITFHPRQEEFDKYQKEFITLFTKKFKEEKYIISYECGKSDIKNHLQIFLDKEYKNNQSLDRGIKRMIKSFEIDNINIALKCKLIKNNINGVIGYVLKETDNEFTDVIYNKFTIEELQEYKQHYLDIKNNRIIIKDKIRIRLKNLHIIMKRFIENNIKELNIKYTNDIDIVDILYKMASNEYECFDLLLNKLRLEDIEKSMNILINREGFITNKELKDWYEKSV